MILFLLLSLSLLEGMYSNKLWANPKFEGMKVKFFNKVDLDKLYKFFTLLLERDSVIRDIKLDGESLGDPLGSPRIQDANDKLNKAAKHAFKDISWEKYAGFRFIKFYVLGNVDPKMTVKFRMLFGVPKDWKYALCQIILIGLIVVVVFFLYYCHHNTETSLKSCTFGRVCSRFYGGKS